MITIHYIGGPMDCFKEVRGGGFPGGLIEVAIPGPVAHTEWTADHRACTEFAPVKRHRYVIRCIGAHHFIAVSEEIK